MYCNVSYLYPYGKKRNILLVIFTYFSNLSQIINDRQLKLYMNKRNCRSVRSIEIKSNSARNNSNETVSESTPSPGANTKFQSYAS